MTPDEWALDFYDRYVARQGGPVAQEKIRDAMGVAYSDAVDTGVICVTAKEGRNYFRVEARLTTPPSDRLRPAMEGVGKIAVDQRSLVWIWTHEVLDEARLKLWAWLP
jgi:hypothetical protein